MAASDPLSECIGFDWDEGNAAKNWDRHRVTPGEAEDLFFSDPLVVRADIAHSTKERRYLALGQTSTGRLLFAAFTVRRKLIRIVSVRDMNQKENEEYRRHERGS